MTAPLDRPSPRATDVPVPDGQTLNTQHGVQAATPSAATLVPPASPTMTAPASPLTTLAGYEILGELGRGGMGVVYQARQQGLGRLERGWRWCKRNPAVASLMALVMLLMGLGTGIAWVLAVRAAASEEEAKQEARMARRRSYGAGMLLAQVAWEQHEMRRLVQLLEEHRPKKESDEDFRSFEWFYWKRQLQRGHVTFEGHTNSVRSVAFSPNGKRIASARLDNMVKVWDAATGQETLTLKGHGHWVHSVAFSADGKRIASGSWDKTVKVWDADVKD